MRRIALLVAYLLIAAALVATHEPWRDELQAWSIARESASLGELFAQTRYEGHPSGWYLLLFALTRVAHSFLAVQWLHLALIGAAVALLIWRAPLSGLQKGLVVFGYFLLYEYAALARNYALGVLGLFAFCVLARDWRRHWLWMQLCLLAMLQANVFAGLLAVALFLAAGLHAWRRAERARRLRQRLALGALLFGAGFALSVIDLRVPPDSSFMPAWHWRDPALSTLLRAIAHAFFPLPRFTLHFWNTSVFAGISPSGGAAWLEGAIALLALVAACLVLRRRPLALLAFALATASIGTLLAVKYAGFLRHHGHFFLALLGAYWLGESLRAAERRPAARRSGRAPRSALLTLLLALQVPASLPAAWYELRHPFSQAGAAAAFIRAGGWESAAIVGQPDHAASAVAMQLGRPIYYPRGARMGSYIVWGGGRGAEPPTDAAAQTLRLAEERGRALLVTNRRLSPEECAAGLAPLAEFAPAIEASEEYFLYAAPAASAARTDSARLRYNGASPQP